MEHHWKQFAEIVDCPYGKRFSTNGYGDYRIDNKGLYSYENKEYCGDDSFAEILNMFLHGSIFIEKE